MFIVKFDSEESARSVIEHAAFNLPEDYGLYVLDGTESHDMTASALGASVNWNTVIFSVKQIAPPELSLP